MELGYKFSLSVLKQFSPNTNIREKYVTMLNSWVDLLEQCSAQKYNTKHSGSFYFTFRITCLLSSGLISQGKTSIHKDLDNIHDRPFE